MAYPSQPEVEDALEQLLRQHGKPMEASTIYTDLAEFFGLSPVERTQMSSDGRMEPKWNNLVQFAKRRLVDRGVVARRLRQPWALTVWTK